ncbi:hypothetical protein JIQ88_12265 [Pseudomonas sp. PCH44]|nr:hypothetical protein [Pseudomonas sp. PCH44]
MQRCIDDPGCYRIDLPAAGCQLQALDRLIQPALDQHLATTPVPGGAVVVATPAYLAC